MFIIINIAKDQRKSEK